ncbi:MAG TPA: ferritin-like domain-containing protein [Pirellulales bacterium]|jgi:bacterioferritin|nr:ferritin-like domain-containing protein [Pirellulales bacterium]
MADKQALIDGLNEDLNLELEAVLRMIYHSATATGLLGHELRESLKEDITGEIGHATYLADKIVALGGEPHIHPQMPKKHKSAKEMLQDDVAAERTIIENYTRHIQMAEELGEKGLVIRLEDILAEETDHAEELERLAR